MSEKGVLGYTNGLGLIRSQCMLLILQKQLIVFFLLLQCSFLFSGEEKGIFLQVHDPLNAPEQAVSEEEEEASFAYCYPSSIPYAHRSAKSLQSRKNSFYFDVPNDQVRKSLKEIFNESGGVTGNRQYYQDRQSPSFSTHNVPSDQISNQKSTGETQADEERSRYLIVDDEEPQVNVPANCESNKEGYTVNFENISVVQLLRFISKISGINFIFDPDDLKFNVSIVSQEPASAEALTSALLQVLKVQGLSVVEQEGTVLIYANQSLSRVSRVITDANIQDSCDSAVVTRVFKLFNVDSNQIVNIIKPLLSKDAIVEVSAKTSHLIVSDITSNVDRIAELLLALDTPDTTHEVAEYTPVSPQPDALIRFALEILEPITKGFDFRMISEPSTGKIYVVANPRLVGKALQVLESLDSADITDVNLPNSNDLGNNHIFMFKLRYNEGSFIADALRDIGSNLQYAGTTNVDLVNAIYSTQWMQVNNSLVITGTKDAVEKVVLLLEELDQPPKQVFLEVLVVDTTLKNSLDFGVQWIALGDEQNKLAYASGLLNDSVPQLQGTDSTNPGARFVSANPTNSPPAIPNPGRDVALPNPSQLAGFSDLTNSTSAFGLGFIGNIIRHNGQSFLTLGALVSALEEEADTTIVLNPRIMTIDNQSASLFVGENIPYQTTSTVVGVTGATTQNVQYEDIGVSLEVTPTISPNNIVTIDIQQTIAELISQQGVLTPTTTRTNTTTRVHVPDKSFLVMSGHIRDKATMVRSGIPCLGTLPLIGPTFSRNVEQREKRNVILFIRPQVVANFADAQQLTNKEGYEFNWNANPCSLSEAPERAPETEEYPTSYD